VRDALLEHNAAFRLLEPAWGVVKLDQPVVLDREGQLEARLFPVPGKVPSWLGALAANHPEATTAVRVADLRSGRRLVYAPGAKALDSGLLAEMEAAHAVFVDGTFFRADELSQLRPGAPGAIEMGHVPIAGAGGSLELLAALRARTAARVRVLYTHLNNTNPVLDAGSEAAAAVRRAGIEVARDGLELEL
jgi:pyrroloquinoline quinone biosynthesis protein B